MRERQFATQKTPCSAKQGVGITVKVDLAERLGIEEHFDRRFIDIISIEHFGG